MRLRSAIALATLAVACTDADLKWAVDPNNPALRMQMEADVCAPEPAADMVPYKVLFVIDTSLSNYWNDPHEKRLAAYRKAIEDYGGQENVYFGIVTFNDTSHRPTVVFTQDVDILTTAGDAFQSDMQTVAGQTNYEDAMTEMMDFIVDDLNAMEPGEAMRTRYHAYWLSDGIPTQGTTDEKTLVGNVVAIREYVETVAAEFVLNGLYLESTGVYETDDEITAARSLIMAMAEAGNGDFTNIATNESFEFDINPIPLLRHFVLGTFVANNLNARFGAEHPMPDSDGDGLRDTDEEIFGTDPTLADTDGDGFRDGVEIATAWLDPGRRDQGCPSRDTDTDGDGLRDCEEDVLGSSPLLADSDGDLLIDSLEVTFGVSALLDEPMADLDLDGVHDWDEVASHLDPLIANSKEEIDLWGYRYHLEPAAPTPDGRPCYALTVTNVGVFETLETGDHPRGAQRLELILAFQTQDQAVVQFMRAEMPIGFLEPNIQNPATGLIEIDEYELALLAVE